MLEQLRQVLAVVLLRILHLLADLRRGLALEHHRHVDGRQVPPRRTGRPVVDADRVGVVRLMARRAWHAGREGRAGDVLRVDMVVVTPPAATLSSGCATTTSAVAATITAA